jgi:hypothetical protein
MQSTLALVLATLLAVPGGGVYDATATAPQICAPGYARAHRHRLTRSERDRIYNAHGLARGSRRGYVLDHEAPLELGGADVAANITPEARPESHAKDRDEDRLHEQVCSGSISLGAARAEMTRLWGRR